MNLRKTILITATVLAAIVSTAASAMVVTTNANGDGSAKHSRVIRHHQGFNAMAQQRGGFVGTNANYGGPDRW